MIHINHGDKPHEWITYEEFKNRFPEEYKAVYSGRSEEDKRAGKILMGKRIRARITIRKMAKHLGISFVELSKAERGQKALSGKLIDKFILKCQE